jgi:SAM-dependent methyltransferase
MNEFEKKYYEAERFWVKGALDDEDNIKRFHATARMIPADVRSLADIGCGNGIFGNYLKDERPDLKLLSVDRSEAALAYVQTDKLQAEIDKLPLPDGSFDCVTCLQVLEHIPNPDYKASLSELARVSKKYLLISVPYNEDLKRGFTECPACGSAFNADLHLRSYSDSTMKNLFKDFGFHLVNTVYPEETKVFVGLGWYYAIRWALHPKQPKAFRSPICLVCGYEETQVNAQPEEGAHSNGQAAGPLGLLKRIWPAKTVPGYTVIGLYEKSDLPITVRE